MKVYHNDAGGADCMPCGSCKKSICAATACGINVTLCNKDNNEVNANELCQNGQPEPADPPKATKYQRAQLANQRRYLCAWRGSSRAGSTVTRRARPPGWRDRKQVEGRSLMTLEVPGFLRAARIQDPSLQYLWDDWATVPGANEPDEALLARLGRLSQRAVLAFACGTGEWVLWRFEGLCDEQAPRDYIEGAWAMTIDVRYCGYGKGTWWENYAYSAKSGWDGPVKRPIRNALGLVEAAIKQRAWAKTDPVKSAGLLSSLASYVMTDPAPYQKWTHQILERLESLYPRNRIDPLGDVVPRQAVDPDFDFHVEQTELLLNNEFLALLDYRTNRFLSSPAGMSQEDDEGESFRGKPYVFDLEDDRRARREALEGGDEDNEVEEEVEDG